MDVIDYLNANIQFFNVELLEMVFDVQNTGDMLDAKQTRDFLESVEENITITPIVIKREPIPREMRVLYFVDLTDGPDDIERRIPSFGTFSDAASPEAVVKPGRKRKQRESKRSMDTLSVEKRSKSQKTKVTKKLERIVLMSTQSK